MKLFLTSGGNPIGRAIIRSIKALELSYDVYALAESADEAAIIEDLGGTAILGDIKHPQSLRAQLSGTDILIHNAERHDLDRVGWREIELINVSVTRKLFHLAEELKIPKRIFMSSTAVYGNTLKKPVNETHTPEPPSFSHYHRTKHLAHYDVIQPMMKAGMPITIVTPGSMYGPDSNYLVDHLMVSFHQRKFPLTLLFGPKTMLTIVHVDDVAEGILKVIDQGAVGEEYILTGPSVTLNELVAFWSRITGRRETVLPISPNPIRTVASIAQPLRRDPPANQLLNPELAGILGTTNIVSAAKAKKVLGWRPRSLQKGMLESFEHIMFLSNQEQNRDKGPMSQLSWSRLLLIGFVLFIVWLLFRSRKKGDQ